MVTAGQIGNKFKKINIMTQKIKNYQSPALDYESPVLMILPVCSTEFVSVSLIGRDSITEDIIESDYEGDMI